jgi:hypothetical protein
VFKSRQDPPGLHLRVGGGLLQRRRTRYLPRQWSVRFSEGSVKRRTSDAEPAGYNGHRFAAIASAKGCG